MNRLYLCVAFIAVVNYEDNTWNDITEDALLLL